MADKENADGAGHLHETGIPAFLASAHKSPTLTSERMKEE